MTITVRSLHIYPIKSCAGIDLAESAIGMEGLSHDRRWLVVDEGGMFLTQRTEPRMALVRPALDDGSLRVEAPGMAPLSLPLVHAEPAEPKAVQVWRDGMIAGDEGNEAAAWFSAFLGRPLRLVRTDARTHRLANRARIDAWLAAYGDLAPGLPADHRFGFADGFPLLVTAQASLDELNERLRAQGEQAVPMDRFRPNIVLDGVEAYDEDYLSMIAIGDVRLPVVKPCSRCPMPDIDQRTAERGEAVGRTLAPYRTTPDGVIFGQNALVQAPEGARVRVGDACELSWTF